MADRSQNCITIISQKAPPLPQQLDPKTMALYFRLFNEVGIINQLSTTTLDKLMPNGLMHTHFNVLNHLTRLGDGSTPLAIANAFQVAKTTMTHTLSGLEKHKLVSIKPNPNDGRSKQVWLTDAGKEMRMQTIQQAAPFLIKSLSNLSEQQVADLVENLANIRQILDSNR